MYYLKGPITAASMHIWEFPGNYRDFGVVMVIQPFYWRTRRILITIVYFQKIYTYTIINILYSGNIGVLKLPWEIYLQIHS